MRRRGAQGARSEGARMDRQSGPESSAGRAKISASIVGRDAPEGGDRADVDFVAAHYFDGRAVRRAGSGDSSEYAGPADRVMERAGRDGVFRHAFGGGSGFPGRPDLHFSG